MSDNNTPKIELAAMIESLRAELVKAEIKGRDEDIRFTVEDVELELDVAVERQAEGKIAAKFYVLTSQFKGGKKNTQTQKLKLKLKAEKEIVDPTTGKKKNKPLKISGKVKAKK